MLRIWFCNILFDFESLSLQFLVQFQIKLRRQLPGNVLFHVLDHHVVPAAAVYRADPLSKPGSSLSPENEIASRFWSYEVRITQENVVTFRFSPILMDKTRTPQVEKKEKNLENP